MNRLRYFLSHKPLKSERLWTVKVKDVKGLDLSFNTRKEARDYKRLLQGSRRQLEAHIVLQESFDGYMVDMEKS